MAIRHFNRANVWGLEVLASDPVSNLFAGRSYLNSTLGRPRYYDGASWDFFNAGATPTIIFTTVSANGHTAVNGEYILADSSGGAFSITLPATPVAGTRVLFYDAKGTWLSDNVTVNRNAENIKGNAANFILNVSEARAEFIYIDGTYGWAVYL